MWYYVCLANTLRKEQRVIAPITGSNTGYHSLESNESLHMRRFSSALLQNRQFGARIARTEFGHFNEVGRKLYLHTSFKLFFKIHKKLFPYFKLSFKFQTTSKCKLVETREIFLKILNHYLKNAKIAFVHFSHFSSTF